MIQICWGCAEAYIGRHTCIPRRIRSADFKFSKNVSRETETEKMPRTENVYDGDWSTAEGENGDIAGWTETKLFGHLRKMKEGDSLSVQARPRPAWYDDPHTVYPPRDSTGTPVVD